MIKIMVDSTCDLPEELIKKYDIKVLPLRVLLYDKDYLDKKTISIDEVYSAMRQGIVPKTSQPNPQDIYNIFDEYCSKAQDFIYLSFSSALSGTYRLAQSILQEFKEKYPMRNMEIIDSKSGSTAIGLIVLKAATLIEENSLSFNEIINAIQKFISRVEHIFTISDLSWLIKGGRIGKAQGVIGDILDIKPIIHVKDGNMEIIKKVRGRKKALNSVIDILEDRIDKNEEQIIGISHADDKETAEKLMELIKDKLGYNKFMVNKIGSVLGSHLGIGGVGVFFFKE